jgi:hypothetical protein
LTGRNWYLLAVLSALMLSVLGLSTASAIQLAFDPFYVPPLAALYSPMFINGVIVDITITFVVSYKLAKSRRGFSHETDTILTNLLAITWESAAPPALCQVINLVVFSTTSSKHSWNAVLNMLTPRLYAFSLLYTLNTRADIRMSSSQGTSGHEISQYGGPQPTRRRSHGGDVLFLSTIGKKDRQGAFSVTGSMPIHVQTETVVHTSSMDRDGHRRVQSANGHGIEVEVHNLKSAPVSQGKEEDGESLDSSRWENSEKTVTTEADTQVVRPYTRYQPGGVFPADSNV